MIPVLHKGVQSSQVVQVFFPPFALIINYLSIFISSVVQEQETMQDAIPNTWQGSTDDTMKPKKQHPTSTQILPKATMRTQKGALQLIEFFPVSKS